MSFKMKANTPVQIVEKIEQLKKKYALQVIGLKISSYSRQVDPQFPPQFIYSIYRNIQQWNINVFCYKQQILSDTNNKFPPNKLIKQITHIKFTQLRRLNLQNCCINSIETLSILNAPFLSQLNIKKNEIYKLKPLIKTKFSNLKILSLASNQFNHDELSNIIEKFFCNNQLFAQFQVIYELNLPDQWNDNGFLDMKQFGYNLLIWGLVKFEAYKIRQYISATYRYRKLRIQKCLQNVLIRKFSNKKNVFKDDIIF